MPTNLPVQIYIEKDILPWLLRYCQEHRLSRFLLVADLNTYPVLGQRLEQFLAGQGLEVKSFVFDDPEVIPDAAHVTRLLAETDGQERTYLAVGSGTITDLTRFISHRTRNLFISLPTAPSVDGFISTAAAMIMDGLKETIYCPPPVAVFAGLETLAAAPQAMIASGFGDVLGKYTSLADWRIGRLIWDEHFEEPIAQRTWQALQICISAAEGIGRGELESIRALTNGLLESGMSMVLFGKTVPASGAEHHLSHHWEMKHIWEKRANLLHGAKVGVAAVLVAGYYEQIRRLSREQAAARLDSFRIDPEQEMKRIRDVYPPISDRLIQGQAQFLDLTPHGFIQLKERILDRWPEILEIAEGVPAPQVMADLLVRAGGPATPRALGLTETEVGEALRHAHYIRPRFTSLKLSHFLGLL